MAVNSLEVVRPFKSCKWNTYFHRKVSNGKTGLPFQKFRLFRKFSSGKNQKRVSHLHPNRNFRNFVVNGKRPTLLLCGVRQRTARKFVVHVHNEYFSYFNQSCTSQSKQDFSLGPARSKIIFWCFILSVLTKLVRSRWLDIGLVLFWRVYGPRLRLGP